MNETLNMKRGPGGVYDYPNAPRPYGYAKKKKSHHKLAWAAVALMACGTIYSVFTNAASRVAQKAVAASTAPLGTIDNPINLDTDPTAKTIDARGSVRQVYVHSDDAKPATISVSGLNLLINAFNRQYVEVQSGDTPREFEIQSVCSGKEPAVKINDADGKLQGNGKGEGSTLTTQQIVAARPILTPGSRKNLTVKLDKNPCDGPR